MSALAKTEGASPAPESFRELRWPVAEPAPRPEITYLIPAYNEAENLPFVVSRLSVLARELRHTFEIVVVDDGSRDESAAVAITLARSYPLRLIRLSRNFGKEKAMTAGIEVAAGNAVIIVDADLQHPVEIIEEFIRLWKEGYEMVYGVRVDRGDESRLKKASAGAFYRLLGRMSSVPIPPEAGDFRLMDRKVVDALRALPENNRFMKGLYHWVGFKSIPVPFQQVNRQIGSSKFSFGSLLRLGITGITAFSHVPLRFAGAAGGVISCCAIFYALWIVIRTLAIGCDVPGWATLTVAILFLGGIQLLFIGVLGEYVGRIFEEVKGRPNYIVAEDTGPARWQDDSTAS